MNLKHVFIFLVVLTFTQVNSQSSLLCITQQTQITTQCLQSIQLSQVTTAHLAYTLAQFCYQKKLYKKSFELFKIVTQAEPSIIQPHYRRILCLIQLYDYEYAIVLQYENLRKFGLAHQKHMNQLLNNQQLQIMKEHWQNNREKSDKELSILSYFLGEFQKSQSLLKNIIKNIKQVSVYHLMYIRNLEKQKKYLNALEFINKVIKNNEDNFYLHHLKGNLLMHHIKFKQAIKQFETTIKLYPLFHLSYYNLALCHQKLSQFQKSLTPLLKLENILDKINEQIPKGKVYNALGYSYYRLGVIDKSESYYKKAIDSPQQQQKAIWYYNLGVLYYELEKYKQALTYLNRSINISNIYQSPRIIKALTLNQLNFTNEALEILNQFQENYQAKYHSAKILLNLNRFQQALVQIQKSIKLYPKNAVAHNCKGLIYYMIGQFQNAVVTFNQAIKMDKNNPQNYFNKGMCLMELKKYSLALQSFEASKKLGYDSQNQINQCKIYLSSEL